MTGNTYEAARKNYPELKLPETHRLDSDFWEKVIRWTVDQMVSERAAYLLGRKSPADWDAWEIDVPF